jgi:hypothetical protein
MGKLENEMDLFLCYYQRFLLKLITTIPRITMQEALNPILLHFQIETSKNHKVQMLLHLENIKNLKNPLHNI